MESVIDILKVNEAIVYFAYGQIFFTFGLSVALNMVIGVPLLVVGVVFTVAAVIYTRMSVSEIKEETANKKEWISPEILDLDAKDTMSGIVKHSWAETVNYSLS